MTSIDDHERHALLIREHAAEILGSAPDTVRLLADADDTDGTMNAVRTTLGPGLDGAPPHFHRHSPELFFLLGGALSVLTGDEVVTVEEGDLLLVPPEMPHAWGTLDEVGADVLAVQAPGGNRFDFFRLTDRIRRGEAAPRELVDAQERYDNHFVDSPVWRQSRARFGDARGERLRMLAREQVPPL